jgi:cytochrome P450
MMTTRMQATAGQAAQLLAALAEPEGRADPYPLYEGLRALGPVVAAPDGALVVTGYQDCSALLRDHRLRKAPERALAAAGYPDWRDRPSLRLLFTSILALDPPAHTRLRRLVSATFIARRVQRLRPAVEQIVAQACEQVAGDNDFVACFAFPLPVTVIGELLGIPAADRPMLRDLVRDWAAVLEILGPQVVDRADAAASAIGGYLADLAAHRRVRPAGDLISALATAQAGDQLTQDELVTTAALLLAAGFETTTGLLANGLVALLAHPGQARRLRTEAGLAASAVEELLRYDSPVQLVPRTAPAGLDVAGLTTSEGQRVVAVLGAANRDLEVFSEPDRLILDRAEQPPLSFGGGIHYCLGAPLARLEAQIAFPALLSRFPRLALTGKPVYRDGLVLHGPASLPVSAR